jgi:general secretion pathway protein K
MATDETHTIAPDTLDPRTARARRRARRRGRTRGQPGVALLLVLTSVALLYVLAQQSRDEVEVYSTAAAASRDQVIAFYQAKSMVNLSRLLLHAEPTIRRGLTPVLAPLLAIMGRGLNVPQIPVWEQADLLLGMFRNRESGSEFGQAVGVNFAAARGLGALSGAQPPVIVDEDAKININGFDRGPHIQRRVAQALLGLFANPSLDPYFTTRDPDGQFTDRVTLVANVIDYGDNDLNTMDVQSLVSNTVTGQSAGAPEDTFYGSLHPPYQRRNAPYDSVDELHMVRGLSDDDLWHAVIDPDPGNPRRRTVTVWGQGAVNVNTANAQTLLALICAFQNPAQPAPQCTDPSSAMQFMTGITMVQAFTVGMGIPLFSNARGFVDTITGRPPMGPMLTALGVQPFTVLGPQLEQSVTTESKVFSIYSEASVGNAHVRIHAVVDMRAQPPIPGTFFPQVRGGREQAQTTAQVATAQGTPATVNAAGGTIIYWRED